MVRNITVGRQLAGCRHSAGLLAIVIFKTFRRAKYENKIEAFDIYTDSILPARINFLLNGARGGKREGKKGGKGGEGKER